MATPNEVRRFERFVDRRGPDECWPWTGAIGDTGYGNFGREGGATVRSHRMAWEIVNGPIPAGDGFHGHVVMHTCDNRSCCNPRHLRLASQAGNLADMDEKGRRQRGEKHAHARLTETLVQEIRAAAATTSRAVLSERYGLSRPHLHKIIRRELWRHVA